MVPAVNAVFDDPCPRTYKTLQFGFRCQPELDRWVQLFFSSHSSFYRCISAASPCLYRNCWCPVGSATRGAATPSCLPLVVHSGAWSALCNRLKLRARCSQLLQPARPVPAR